MRETSESGSMDQLSSHPWPGMIRRVAWTELCPWLLVFRGFRVATSLSVILLGTIGLLLTPLGWLLGEVLFVGSLPEDSNQVAVQRLRVDAAANREMAQRPVGRQPSFENADWLEWMSLGTLGAIYSDFVAPYHEALLVSGATLSEDDQEVGTLFSLRRYAYYLFGAIWMLLVWAFCGGAISRIAVLRLARDERVGLIIATRYVATRYLSYLTGPLLPLVLVLIFSGLMAIPGLLLLFDAGAFVVSLGWGVLLLAGFVIGLLLLVLAFAWPMMFSVISAEGSDGFDAVTRSFAYTYQRPLQYAFCVGLTLLLMAAGALLSTGLCEMVIQSTRWGTSWGAGARRVTEITTSIDQVRDERLFEFGELAPTADEVASEDDQAKLLGLSGDVIGFWENSARSVRSGFLYGLFWCLASAVYLILRLAVDETVVDEVFDDQVVQTDALPTLEPPPALDLEPKAPHPDDHLGKADEANASGSTKGDEESDPSG